MMPRIQENLPHLFALAHDKTEAGRARLASDLLDLFLSDDIHLTVDELEQLNLLVDELLTSHNAETRGAFIRRLISAARLSRPLALKLAAEPLDVARDVLIANDQLTDEDLIQVIETVGRDHARVIAQRREIAEVVVDALVTTCDMQVMQCVAENLGAHLSSKALVILSDAARLTISLQAPMVRRPEMTEALSVKLYWWVAQDLRRDILKRFGMNASRLTEKLSETIEEKLGSCTLQKNDEMKMGQLADWLEERDALSAKLLPQILRSGHFRLFNILLGRLSGLDKPVIDMVANEAGGRALATLCRALGVEKANFVSIFLLSRGARPGEHIVHPRELSFALAAFDRVSLKEAHDIIHSWQVQPA